ncbi:MAG: hypothetical protein IJ593_02165, partial [Lachnospiraceae bacterium]|nr:hypothetical protein [Lachnospiraceae bacterium]
MRSHFNFKSLFERLPNVSIPKEFIYFGIGAVLVVLLGLIAGNMYLQEMLFFEGQEKSVQLFTEEELREYGELYKELSLDFQNKIGYIMQDYANRTNRAGEKIHYGIYNHEHPELNRSKIHPHNNGSNVNAAEPIGEGIPYVSEYDDSYNDFPYASDDMATFIDTEEFKNGITVKYAKTEGRADGESNFQDILTVVSMITDQRQTRDGSNDENIDVKEKIPELIKKLFRMSHTFSGTSTQLYSCEKGCRVLFYYCNEDDNRYNSTGIDLRPFQINPNDDLDDYGEEDFDIVGAEGECVICGHNGKGCVKDSQLCFHGTLKTISHEGSEVFRCEHSVGNNPASYGCDNYIEKPFCTHFECNHENECPHDNETGIGCAGCYECKGHDHWNCPGHFYVCCMGHTDITLNIHIMYVDEMIN